VLRLRHVDYPQRGRAYKLNKGRAAVTANRGPDASRPGISSARSLEHAHPRPRETSQRTSRVDGLSPSYLRAQDAGVSGSLLDPRRNDSSRCTDYCFTPLQQPPPLRLIDGLQRCKSSAFR
jgi:hypothetical protein